MYNLWWVGIGLGVATLAFGILYFIFNSRSSYYGLATLTEEFIILTSALFAIVLLFAIVNPIIANKKYNGFLETKVLVEQLSAVNYDQYENAGLNAKIIELNQWLVQAKASKKQYGNWSMYCGLDIENLDYIVLGGVQE